MGNSCCRSNPDQHELVNGDEENQPKSFTKQPTSSAPLLTQELQKKNSIRLGPDLFVKLKKGDIYSFYSIGKALGEGAYGSVSLVTHKKSQMKRAMKSLKKSALFEEDEQLLFAELNILKEIDHPNIVKLYDLYQDEKFYYLVTEYLSGGELFDRIQKQRSFSEKDAAKYMRQVMSAVAYCHSKNIVHRDLKPENIIFSSSDNDADIKVIDFGTSRKMKEGGGKMTKRLGTPYYIAPEVLQKNYDEKCDIWSCGVIMYILLAGYPPFNGRSEQDIFAKILKGKITFYPEEWNQISHEAKHLITKMLEPDVKKRLSAEQVLKDPWIQKNQGSHQIGEAVLDNLAQFRAKGQLKHALLTFMATQMINQKEQEDLQKTFRELDKNGDGTLTKEELLEAFQMEITDKQKVVENLDERVQKIFDKVDINNSGKIDYTEFIIAGLEQEKLITQQKIEQAFQILDLDGDQYISKEELQQVMEGLDDDIWNEFLKECDQDNDGKISRQEFIDILLAKV